MHVAQNQRVVEQGDRHAYWLSRHRQIAQQEHEEAFDLAHGHQQAPHRNEAPHNGRSPANDLTDTPDYLTPLHTGPAHPPGLFHECSPATMTTIVYRKGVLAGDTQVSMGEMRLPERMRKVRRLRDGRLFAWAGKMATASRVAAALNAGEDLPKLTASDGQGIIVDLKGRVFTIEEGEIVPCTGVYTARGSGKEYAFGALAMGASAVEAVRVARDLDHYTGGTIQTVKLHRRG